MTKNGHTSAYLGVGGQVYIKAPALSGWIQDTQVSAAGGKWVLMTGAAPFNDYRDLSALGWMLTPLGQADPTPGPARTIDGVATIALVNSSGGNLYVGVNAPYRPYLSTAPETRLATTYMQWDAATNPLPTPPAPGDVYDPTSG